MNTVAVPSASRSIWAIIGDIFFAPIQALEDFKKKPNWVVPFVLCLIVIVVASGLPYKQNAKAQFDMMSTSTTLPPQVIEGMRSSAENPSPITNTIGGVIGFSVVSLISALLAWVIGSFIFGQKARYVHVWAVGLLVGLVPAIGTLLRSVLIVAKDSILVSLGPAALMAGSDFTSFVYSFLYFADVFAIWGIILGGLGYAAIFGLSRGKGMTISVIVWLIIVLALVGLQQFGLAMAGVKTSFI
ncbi:MAG: YIP1 family protein [Candidatus Zixiibacteriota bacterium]